MKIGSNAINDIKVGSTPVNKVYRNGVLYWEAIPNILDSLLWLDGTILNNSGTYYFIDKSGNSRNFLITNYDFDSTWTLGFPYKSAATISAPVGDATLIAADINNYLYDSGGTPNQIPVISLFQDVDYEHKLFSRHIAQVVDGNGVETYEPRVVDIVLYNTVKAGSDLTNCNTFYGVPTESGTAKWVDPVNGNDTTGDGSKALPWKLISKAHTTMTSGTCYVKTGSMIQGGAASWVQLSKDINFTSVGFTNISAVSTAYAIFLWTGVPTQLKLKGFNFDGTGTQWATVYGFTNPNNVIIEKCRFLNPVICSIQYGALSTNPNIRDCIFVHNNNQKIIALTNSRGSNIIGNYFSGTSRSCIEDIDGGNINYNKFYNNINPAAGTIQINQVNNSVEVCNVKFNYFKKATTGSDIRLNTTTSKSVFNISRNTHIINGNGTAVNIPDGGNNVECIVNVNYNYYEQTNYSTNALIAVADHSKFIFENNKIIRGSGTATRGVIDITSKGRIMDGVVVRNNYISDLSTTGYHIKIGADAPDAYNFKITGAIVEKNHIVGYRYNSKENITVHGVLIGYVLNSITRFNYINGSGLAIVIKGLNDASETGVCNSNILLNCYYNIYLKGCKNQLVYNNTLINNQTQTDFIGVFLTDNNTYICESNFIKNNIIVSMINSAYSNHFIYTTDSDTLNNTFDHNIYYHPISSKILFNYSTVIKTFTEWQGLNYDTNSLTGDPLISDITTEDFSLNTISPAINIGEDLGSSYNTGLDASTDWGSSTDIPAVVTKTQGASWSLGAYI